MQIHIKDIKRILCNLISIAPYPGSVVRRMPEITEIRGISFAQSFCVPIETSGRVIWPLKVSRSCTSGSSIYVELTHFLKVFKGWKSLDRNTVRFEILNLTAASRELVFNNITERNFLWAELLIHPDASEISILREKNGDFPPFRCPFDFRYLLRSALCTEIVSWLLVVL